MDLTRTLLSCVLLSLCSTELDAEYVSSLVDLVRLMDTERLLINETTKYLQHQTVVLQIIKSRINKLREANVNHGPESYPQDALNHGPESYPQEAVNHPLETLRTIRRFLQHWSLVLSNIQRLGDKFEDYMERVGSFDDRSPVKADDVLGSLRAVVRLQEVCGLRTAALASGLVLHSQSDPLGLAECRNLAVLSLRRGQFHHALQWLQEAEQRADEQDLVVRVNLKRLAAIARDGIKFLNSGNSEADVYEESETLYDDDLYEDELGLSTAWEGDLQSARDGTWAPRDTEENQQLQIPEKQDFWLKYEALCRDEKVKVASSLVCRYKADSVPCNRWKEEVLHWDPLILRYYDVITDAQNARMIQLAEPQLKVAETFNEGDAKEEKRVGKITWLNETEATVAQVTGRVSRITGLDASYAAESFQLSVYGTAGLYQPHHDYQKLFRGALVEGKPIGDRLATFMIYMNDVEAGGATVFPLLDAAVAPIKNSAVFWYNLGPGGKPDARTLHAACPVVLGHKWVANKWMHEYGQIEGRCQRRKKRSVSRGSRTS